MPPELTAWLLEQSAAVVLLSAALLYGYRQHLQALAAADRRCQRSRRELMQQARTLTEQVIAGSERRLAALQAELHQLRDQHQADLQRVEARCEQYQAAAQRREAQLIKGLTAGPDTPPSRPP